MTGPGGREVGRVSIRVVPDTGGFKRDLEATLERFERTLRIEIPVDLDTSGLDEQLRRAAQQRGRDPIKVPTEADPPVIPRSKVPPVKVPLEPLMAAFTRQVRADLDRLARTAEANIPLTAKGNRLREQISAQITAAEATLSADIPVDPEGMAAFRQKLATQVAAATRTVRARVPVDVDTDRLAQVVRRGGGLSRILAGISSVVAGAVTSVFRLTGSLFGMGEAFGRVGSQVGGVLGGFAKLVVVGGSVAGLLGLVQVAVLGVAGALGAVAGAAPAMLASIAVPMGAVALGMDGIKRAAETLRPEFDHLKFAVSAAFEQGLLPAFETLRAVFPTVETGMVRVADSLSMMAQRAATFLASAEGLRLIEGVFAGWEIFIGRAQAGLGALGAELLRTAGYAPLYRIFGDIIDNLTGGFARWLEKARESGALTAAFGTLRDVLKSAGSWLGSLVDAGMEFLAGAGPGLVDTFRNLKEAFSQVDWQSLGKSVGDMMRSLSNIDPVAVGLFVEGVKSLFDRVKMIADTGIIDVFIASLGVLAGMLSVLLKPLELVAGALGWLGDVLGITGNKAAPAADKFNAGMHRINQGAHVHSQQAALGFQGNMGTIPPAAHNAGAGGAAAFAAGIAPIGVTATQIGRETTGNITAGLAPMPSAAQHVGSITHGNLRNSMAPIPGMAGQVGNDASNRWSAGVGRSAELGRQAGQDGGAGFIDGLRAWFSAAWGVGAELARMAWNAAKSALGIASPSKRFAELGRWSGEGLVRGMADLHAAVGAAGRRLALATIPDLGTGITAPMDGLLAGLGSRFDALRTVFARVNDLIRDAIPDDLARRWRDAGRDLGGELAAGLRSRESALAARARGMVAAEDGSWVPPPLSAGGPPGDLVAALSGMEFVLDESGGRAIARLVNRANRLNTVRAGA